MKTIVWAIVTLLIAVAVLLEFRYALIVNTPIVTKMDRLTGDAWIVNSGVWKKIQYPPAEMPQPKGNTSQAAKPAK